MKKLKVGSSQLTVGSWIILLIVIIFSQSLLSQNVSVNAKLDSNSILIGEQTKLHLSVSYKPDQGDIQILWPTLGDTLGTKNIEIVEKSKIDTTIPDKTTDQYVLVQSQVLTLTSFDSGFYAIPPLKFIVNGDSLHPKETDALLLQVNNVPIDTTKAIREIKPPLEVPYGWLDVLKEYLPLIGYTLLGIAILAALVYYLRKFRKAKPVVVAEDPKIPPHIIALQELEKLRDQKLWQEGKFKQYHSSISDIIRGYIEKRFKVQALEQTTDEIIQSFRSIVIDKESKEKLKRMLVLADLVKFAKEEPLPNENELSLNLAFEFINGTSREEENEAGTSQTAADNQQPITNN